MKIFKFFVIVLLFTALFYINLEGKKEWPVLKGPYLGQKPPGMTAEIFAPGIISLQNSRDLMHGFFDGSKLFILNRYPVDFKGDWTKVPVILMKLVDGKWTAPYPSKLIGKPWFYNLELVPEGKRVIFAWTSSLDGSGPPRELYLWSSIKAADGWITPIRFKQPVNTGFETWPTLSADKTLYFMSRRSGGMGRFDIYWCKPENGEYKIVKNLGKIINTKYTEEDPYIDPDGSFLLFDSNRPGGYGSYDIYITYRRVDGSWTKPINLGDRINSKYSECRAYVSPEGKYLFFTSNRKGDYDAFWVDAKIIENLKPRELR